MKGKKMEYYILKVEKKDQSEKKNNEDIMSSNDLKRVFLYADFALNDESTQSIKIVKSERKL